MIFRCRSGAFGAIVLSAFALPLLLATPALSASIYRCGNSYSQSPCDGSDPLKVEDPRTDEQRRDSVTGQRANSKLADRMERDRLKFESENKPYAGVVGARQIVMAKSDEKKIRKETRAKKPKSTLNTQAGAPFVAHASAAEGAEKPAKAKKKRAKKSADDS